MCVCLRVRAEVERTWPGALGRTKAMLRVAVVRWGWWCGRQRGSGALSSRVMEGRCDRLGGGRGSRSSGQAPWARLLWGGLRGVKRMGVAVEAAQDRLWEQRLTLANHNPQRHAGLPKNRGGRGDRAGSVRPGNLPHLHTRFGAPALSILYLESSRCPSDAVCNADFTCPCVSAMFATDFFVRMRRPRLIIAPALYSCGEESPPEVSPSHQQRTLIASRPLPRTIRPTPAQRTVES